MQFTSRMASVARTGLQLEPKTKNSVRVSHMSGRNELVETSLLLPGVSISNKLGLEDRAEIQTSDCVIWDYGQ